MEIFAVILAVFSVALAWVTAVFIFKILDELTGEKHQDKNDDKH